MAFQFSPTAFQFSPMAFRFSSTAFHFPRNPRKCIYGKKYTKDCYSSFVFFATCSPSFLVPAKQYLHLTQHNRPGKPLIRILYREGIAQVCSLSMNLYEVALLPLLKRMQVAVPDALAPAYADDTAAAGKTMHNAACLCYLLHHGPRYSYLPDPRKSWYICKVENKAVA
jgi:hypothetical protein